jgi:hypothetical protein
MRKNKKKWGKIRKQVKENEKKKSVDRVFFLHQLAKICTHSTWFEDNCWPQIIIFCYFWQKKLVDASQILTKILKICDQVTTFSRCLTKIVMNPPLCFAIFLHLTIFFTINKHENAHQTWQYFIKSMFQ